jgi:hypothetical protein
MMNAGIKKKAMAATAHSKNAIQIQRGVRGIVVALLSSDVDVKDALIRMILRQLAKFEPPNHTGGRTAAE